MDLKSLETELLKLSPKDKAAIAYMLLENIEDDESVDFEEVRITEVLQRYSQLTEEQKKLILYSYQQSESENNLISHKAVISNIKNEL
ncbi:MAG: hypothetical protein M1480_07980 [Bacteroidetes bacterium]|nr:hypothetical protein [Bacteroidota bacterium]